MQIPRTEQHLRRNPTFLAMVAFGAVGLLVLLSGLGLYIYFEPVNQNSGITVQVTGVKEYDPATGTVSGKSKVVFSDGQIPAAVVDWSGVSRGLQVEAAWYDAELSTAAVSSVGPQAAGTMPAVVALVPAKNLLQAGVYVFVVGRYAGGRMVEVLARQEVQVT